jgi:hypothetical protein|tara:strand:- start:352 stop:570 length:219 start_codon:yes stop_codon:yes gene_type:complete
LNSVRSSVLAAGTSANVTRVVAIANGGKGSATQNFIDLTTTQTVAGLIDFSFLIAKRTANFRKKQILLVVLT